MPLSTALIRSQLAAAPGHTKDNVAQKLIATASPTELKSLDVEGVLRLYHALVMCSPSWVSSRDSAALDRLAQYTQFQPMGKPLDNAISLIKRAKPQSAALQVELPPDLIGRLYGAEGKRLSLLERIGIDGRTIGRGQLSQDAYDDVRKPNNFKAAWETFFTQFSVADLLKKRPGNSLSFDFVTFMPKPPANYDAAYKVSALEDFVVAAYLAVWIVASEKAGRSSKDAARFAVARYHGMFKMVSSSQQRLNESILWQPIAADLVKSGNGDAIAYIDEVVQ